MGLRDRGYVLDYYIPLFAGVDAAKRDRFRTKFPFSIYAPYYSGGGTCTPGGIGGGDGGFGTAIDFAIHTPTITSPAAGATGVTECSAINSSAFASDDGETHIASRWMIETLNQVSGSPVNTATGVYIYDSGPSTSALTILTLLTRGLNAGKSYRVTVRHKGSNGGWSDWSVPVVFTMRACGADCSLLTFTHSYSLTLSGSTIGTSTGTLALPSEVSGWNNLKVYVRYAAWDDYGSVGGSVATLTPTYTPGSTTVYSGADFLISQGTATISWSNTNTVGPAASFGCTLYFTGTP